MAPDETAKIVLLALITSSASAVATLWAASATGASALVAIGFLFLATAVSQALMLFGLNRQSRTRTSDPEPHPADLYVWSYVAALILFSLAAGIAIDEGIGKLISPPRILLDPPSGYAAIAFAMILTAAALVRIAIRKGPNGTHEAEHATLLSAKDPALHTTAVETIAALAGLQICVIGFALSHAFNSAPSDANAAILIGLLIGTVAAAIGVEIRRLLLKGAPERAQSARNAVIEATLLIEASDADDGEPATAPFAPPQKSAKPRSRGAQKRREREQRRRPH